MIEKYGLFDSIESDVREYAEADFALLVRTLGLDGVRGGTDALKVSAADSGLRVRIAPGMALVQGRYYALEDDGGADKLLTLEAAAGYPRIDRIVLTLDYVNRTVKLHVLKGSEAQTPAAPALVRNAMAYMLSLAQVRVEAGASALTDAAVTDERANGALCGLHAYSVSEAMQEIGGKAPVAHASADTAYGLGTGTLHGHVKLSDAVDESSRAAGGVAATPYAVRSAYNKAASAYSLAENRTTIIKMVGMLYASGWTDSVPYTQAVSWPGFVASDTPMMDLDTEDMTADTAEALVEAYSMVDRIEAVDNQCNVYCYREKPAVDLPILLLVIRAN